MFSFLSPSQPDLSASTKSSKSLPLKSKMASSTGLLVCAFFLLPLALPAFAEQNENLATPQILETPRVLGALSEKDMKDGAGVSPKTEAAPTAQTETSSTTPATNPAAPVFSLGKLSEKDMASASVEPTPDIKANAADVKAPKPPRFAKSKASGPLPPPPLTPPQITALADGAETLPLDVLKQASTSEPPPRLSPPAIANAPQANTVTLGAPEKPLGTLAAKDLEGNNPETPKDRKTEEKRDAGEKTAQDLKPAAKTAAAELNQTATASLPPTGSPSAKRPLSFAKLLGTHQGALSLEGLSSQQFQPDITEPLRLEEAVAFALKNNFDVQASQSRTKSARWEKIGAYSEMLPSLEYTYSKGKEHSHPASFNDSKGDRTLDSEHFRQDRAFTARQPLIDLGIIADILKSSKAKDLADSDNLDARETVAIDTINVFLKLVQARITIQLADRYKSYLQNLMTRMQDRVEGGGATSADLDRIRSRFTIADAARLEALGSYGISLTEFRRLTKITPAQFEIPDQFAPEIPPLPQDALERAVKMNPAYQSGLKKIDVAQADRNRSLAALSPKLSLEYSNIHSENAGGIKKGNPIDGIHPKQKDSRFMMVARWSMNGGTSVAQGFAGTEKMREMNFRAQEIRARLEQSIFTGYDALTSARKRLDILGETLETDRRVVRDFEDQHAQGSRSLFDVLDAYERRHNTQLEVMRTMIGEAQAAYQIRRQMGDLSRALVRSATEDMGR